MGSRYDYVVNIVNQKVYKTHKRRGIGQYPIFSKPPYFSSKKHTKVALKVKVWAQKALFLCHLCSISRALIKKAQHTNLCPDTYYQETPKVPPMNMPSGHIWISNTGSQVWYFLLAPIY